MKTANPVDVARIELLLSELRLPAMKLMWAKFAEQSDKEGWPAARFLAPSPNTRSPIAVVAASNVTWPKHDCPSVKQSPTSTSRRCRWSARRRWLRSPVEIAGSKKAPIFCCSARLAEAKAISRPP